MVGSTIFPKVDGDILYADDVNSIGCIRNLFSVISQNTYNNVYAGWNANLAGNGSPVFRNTEVNVMNSNNTIGPSGNIKYTSNYYYLRPTYDNTAGASLDGTRWASGGGPSSAGSSLVYLSGGYIIVYAEDNTDGVDNSKVDLLMSGTNRIDFKSGTGNSKLYFDFTSSFNRPAADTVSAFMGFTDYASNIWIGSRINDATNNFSNGSWVILIDRTNQKAVTWVNDSQTASGIDLSSLGSWYLKFTGSVDNTGVGTPNIQMNLKNMRYLRPDSAGSILFSGNNITSNINNFILNYNYSGTVQAYVSANSGANWIIGSNNYVTNFTNNGSFLRYRFDFTTNTTPDESILHEYMGIYQLTIN